MRYDDCEDFFFFFLFLRRDGNVASGTPLQRDTDVACVERISNVKTEYLQNLLIVYGI